MKGSYITEQDLFKLCVIKPRYTTNILSSI